jgi:MscS family membrane protein
VRIYSFFIVITFECACNIVAFTKTTSKDKYQQVKQKILLNIADIIAKHKAEIAYPTQTLHIQK